MLHSFQQDEQGKCERNNPVDTQVSEEGGKGGAPGTRAEIPLQPLEQTIEKLIIPLQPVDGYSGADVCTASPDRTPCHTRWRCPEGSCSLWRARAGAGSWQEPWPVETSRCRSGISVRNFSLWGTLTGEVCSWKDYILGRGPMLGQFLKNCSLWEGSRVRNDGMKLSLGWREWGKRCVCSLS